MRELDQQKDDFLSQVSHEVRTPMTAIRAFSEILLDEKELQTSDRERFVETIHRESLRLTNLLDEILDLSALERGERRLESRRVDAEDALARALGVCHALARQRGTALNAGHRASSSMALAEPHRLSRVLINLISNAIKYIEDPNPVVTVRGFHLDGRYVVEVADNGPGIRADEAGRIFDKFYRGDSGEESAAGGAGLGLAISREIIARLQGRLEMIEGRRKGACFRLTLPLLADRAG